jgi:hypothetical protein
MQNNTQHTINAALQQASALIFMLQQVEALTHANGKKVMDYNNLLLNGWAIIEELQECVTAA